MIPKPLLILGRKEKEEGKEELFYPKHYARQLVLLIFYHSFKGDIIKPILQVRKQRFKYQSVCPRSQAGNKW